MLDYSALLYDPVYAEIGVEAQFINGEFDVTLTVIDDTRPKILPAGSAEVRSVGPGAFVRIPELARNGISRAAWMDASLSFNGRSWMVRSYELRGSPNGEDFGEVRFLLKAVEVAPPPNGGTDWVPANAKIHIDFLGGSPQGRAWTEVDGEVSIDTLLGGDPNTENGWDVSAYDPAEITVDGLVSSTIVAFIGHARDLLLDGATTKFVFKHVDDYIWGFSFVYLTVDGSDAIDVDTGTDKQSLILSTWSGSSVQIDGVENAGTGAVNGVAATVTSSRFEAAANGSAVCINTNTLPGVGAIMFKEGMHSGLSHLAIQSITIYDPLPDTTGLSELSAIGG